MREFLTYAGPTATILSFFMGVFYFVGGRLIDRYYKLQEKTEDLKGRYVEKQIQHLKEILGTFRGDVDDLRVVLASVQVSINHLNETMATTSVRQEHLTKKLEDFATEVKARIETLERSEMVPIGNGKYILKGRPK